MKATYCEALSIVKQGDTVIEMSGTPMLLIGLSYRLYAFTSPRASGASGKSRVRRKDSRK